MNTLAQVLLQMLSKAALLFGLAPFSTTDSLFLEDKTQTEHNFVPNETKRTKILYYIIHSLCKLIPKTILFSRALIIFHNTLRLYYNNDFLIVLY